MVIGYVLAFLAALGSGVGSVMESAGIRRAGAFGGDSDDFGKISRQPLYFCGVAVDILAFVAGAAALHRLPLFLVQSVLAFSVGVTATISAIMGTRLGRMGWVSLCTAAAGLVTLGLSANPGPAHPLPHGWRWIILCIVVPVCLIGFYGSRSESRWGAAMLAFGAGLGFTAVAVSARTLHLPREFLLWFSEPSVWAIILNGVAATAVFALALQKGTATTMSAIMFTTNTVLPSVIGLTLLGDSIRAGWAVPAGFGFVLAISGAVALAHFSTPPPSIGSHNSRAPSRDGAAGLAVERA
ncbi:MFS family permease [Nakamurella sp. UYEF19]|uniref:hypothetical protein n=1 Tax=Nakamurella sp. UYEF19 TaxID=1756392 RepID=UPI0033939107